MKKAPLTKEAICALVQQKTLDETEVSEKTAINIPAFAIDAVETLSDPGLTWIKKYGIFNDEIREHDILWSQSQEQLIFPIYNDDFYTIAWQARNFKPGARKYVTFGHMDDILHILGLTKHPNSDIIIVEDLVSAIKVSRHYRCLPLFGSGCSREKLNRLRRYTDHIRFWLDRDKFGAAMKMAKIATQLGFKTDIIHTEKDPKEHLNSEIRDLGAN